MVPWRRSRRRAGTNLFADLELYLGRWPRVLTPAMIWRWRHELIIAIDASVLTVVVIHLLGPGWSLLCATVAGFGIGLWPPSRAAVAAHAWWLITPHRVRVGCVQARIFSRNGRLPIILRTSIQPFGERVVIWCTAGTSAEDFQMARSILCAACWAADIRIEQNARYAHLVTLDVIRRLVSDHPSSSK
jgi:hypothetical protein